MILSERQLEIIDVSIEIIAEQGIQGLTIKNLSKKIGISEPAIYRHFDSKTEILLTILDNFMEMATFMGEAMKDNNNTALSKIEFMFLRIIDIFIDTPSYISVIFAEEVFKNEEVLKRKIISILNLNEQTVENIIKSGQEKGEVRNDINYKTLALIVMGTLRFRIKQWDLQEYKGNLQKEGVKLIDNLKLILE
jgi:AcrR family transcriptional regulator